jgi:nucleotide-binding universal stress UspA family protein
MMVAPFILTLVEGREVDRPRMEMALNIARLIRGDVEIYFPGVEPLNPAPLIANGLTAALIGELREAAQREEEVLAVKARANFDEWLHQCSLKLYSGVQIDGELSASWREERGTSKPDIVAAARNADLVVTGLSDEPGSQELLKVLLFGTGRSILGVPPDWKPFPIRCVAVLWNGSSQAARAVGDVLQLLEAVEAVLVLTADEHPTPIPTGAVVGRLARCGISRVTEVRVSRGKSPIGAALLACAQDAGADLIVMGAYGHSRVREFVLGGVTRHVLAKSHLPLLMAH